MESRAKLHLGHLEITFIYILEHNHHVLPGGLLDGLEEAGVAEGVPAPGHVGLRNQLKTDWTEVIHVFVLRGGGPGLGVAETEPRPLGRVGFIVTHFRFLK